MTRSLLVSAMAGLALVLGCAGEAPLPVADPATKRTLDQGELVGFSAEGAQVWRGIPFAEPPVGELRWKAPRPPQPWPGLLEALEYGEACPQFEMSGETVSGQEDCLTLNIHAPAAAAAGEGGLPVMFFIHGGGNTIGSAEVYDASRLAAENGVVVVTIHYRLGVLGWLAHSALREVAATPEDASGNFATLDMIRALRWVNENIAAFGGDPGNVTIFGESAGGVNVYSLLLAPPAKGLFHRAIAQSGFATSFPMAEAENATDHPEAPGLPGSSTDVLLALLQREGKAADRESAKALLAAMDSAAIRTYLDGLSAEELLASFSGGGAMGGMYFSPWVFRDGHVILDEEPLDAFRAGHHNRVPTIVGTNRDEHRLFQAFVSPHVSHFVGMPLRIRDLGRYQTVAEYGSKLWKASGADEPATAMRASQRAEVWVYRFDWDEEPSLLWLDLADLIGAAHALELLFVFGGTDSELADGLLVEDVASAEELSRQMRSYWAHFARTGDPDRGQEGDLPRWPAWAAEGSGEKPRFLVFDSARDAGLHTSEETLTTDQVIDAVGSDPRLEDDADRCEVYAGFVQWSAEMTPEEYDTVGGGMCKAHPLEARTPAG